MTLLQHPVFPDQQREVPEKDVQDWVDSGWDKVPAKEAANVNIGPTKSSFEENLESSVVTDPPVSFMPTSEPAKTAAKSSTAGVS